MRKLLLATGNPGKLREMRALLGDLPVQLLDPDSLGLKLQVEESEQDYAANARLKATTFARASGLWALADDSGLEVEALGGGPGPRSARLAGPEADDEARRQRLLELLAPHPPPWPARFRCVMALAGPDGAVDVVQGTCRGEILPEPRGRGGFGYDPLFLVEGMERTMAELAPHEKNRVSHRARAMQAMLPLLRARLGLGED